MREKRRILIQEEEDSDTDVVFWNENTRPEDIMEGKDLEDFYRSQRHFAVKDDSSDLVSQRKHFEEASRHLNMDPSSIPGYKTFFQEGESLDTGIPANLQKDFMYYDSLLEAHPELQGEYEKWQSIIESALSMDVKSMTDKEFQEKVRCPEAILKVVDEKHKSLFQLNRKDFLNVDMKIPPSPTGPVDVLNLCHCRRRKRRAINTPRQVEFVQ